MNYVLECNNAEDHHAQEIVESLKQVQWPCPECSGQLVLKTGCCRTFMGCTSAKCEASMSINDSCLVALIKKVMEQLSYDHIVFN